MRNQKKKTEQTFILFRPYVFDDKVLLNRAIEKIYETGLEIRYVKKIKLLRDAVGKIYYKTDEELEKIGKAIRAEFKKRNDFLLDDKTDLYIGTEAIERAKKHMASGFSLLIVLEGENAITAIASLAGATDPVKAEADTIRGMSFDSIYQSFKDQRFTKNVCHTPKTVEEYERDIKICLSVNKKKICQLNNLVYNVYNEHKNKKQK